MKDATDRWPSDAPSRSVFTRKVLKEGKHLYRDLPWRNIDDPYAVLVSEVMLQQTQVTRVLKYWQRWMALFPTVDALAAADVADVLVQWQGLGYNRRALMLKRAADFCATSNKGILPSSYDGLIQLPGVGPATAAGVMAFAYNKPGVYLETNVRTVFLHELFPYRDKVPDRELIPLVRSTCPVNGVRDWYYALLDYGSYLKSCMPNPSRRSAHHVKQSVFEGSRRQKRAYIVREVLANPGVSIDELQLSLNAFEHRAGRGDVDASVFDTIVQDLLSEGFFHQDGQMFFT